MNIRLKRLISLTISVCLALSIVVVTASADEHSNGFEGDSTSAISASGGHGAITWNQFGYRVYIASGSKVISPIRDIWFSDARYARPLYIYDNSRTTILGHGTVADCTYVDDMKSFFGNPMPMPSNYSGNTFSPGGDALKKWFMEGSWHCTKNKDGEWIEHSNFSQFIGAYFPDFYDDFGNKEKNYKLIVETLAWPAPWDQNGKPYGRNIYGTVREIAQELVNHGYSNYGGKSGWLTNQVIPYSLVTLYSDWDLGIVPPTGDCLKGKQGFSFILDQNYGGCGCKVGYGTHIYYAEDRPHPSESPIVTGPTVTGPSPTPTDSPTPPVPDVPVGPEILIPSDEPVKPSSVFSHYASASYTKSANFNLNLTSTQWSLSKRATSGKDGWQGKNQVLPGGAIYSLNTDKTYVKLNTWQGYWGDGESAAVHKHKDFLSQAENALDNWQVTQYVNSDTGAGNAFGGMQVASGGKSLSALGLKNKTSSESKYYLRDGTNNNKANESDLDVIAAGTGYAK